jgi:hypothetical protein
MQGCSPFIFLGKIAIFDATIGGSNVLVTGVTPSLLAKNS